MVAANQYQRRRGWEQPRSCRDAGGSRSQVTGDDDDVGVGVDVHRPGQDMRGVLGVDVGEDLNADSSGWHIKFFVVDVRRASLIVLEASVF